jgi:antagonist of KipI
VNATALGAGFLTTVQDLGRAGFRQFGVSLGGALDAHALRVANLLVGNNESAAGLEVTFGGLRLRLADERLVAWSGGEFDAHFGSTSLPAGHPVLIREGEELVIERPKTGCRAWVAVSGGFDVPVVLGGRSTDLRGHFGGKEGRALRHGDKLPLGQNSERTRILIDKLQRERIARWKPPHDWSSPAKREPVLHIVRGSDWNRFDDATVQRFTRDKFVVSPDSDRMGVRFEGPQLKTNEPVAEPAGGGQLLQPKWRIGRGKANGKSWATQLIDAIGCPSGAKRVDLVSEAVAPGTIQIPPSGKPILLLGDCQTIGGYPKIAHVITVDLSIASQLRAGDEVRFREVTLADAHQLLINREQNLEQFRRGLQPHFS